MRRGVRATSLKSEAPGPRNRHGQRSRPASGPSARPARFETEMLALRARLAPLLEARRNVVIGVTSCGPEEGVTTISRELSRVLATDEMEVLLCGPCGDLSTSSNTSPGERKITRTVVPHLSFAEINDLHRETCDRRSIIAFRAWLERVKSNYAVTILDTPPIIELGGWETLFRLEDGLLLVLEAERTRTSVIRATLDTIESAGGNVLGIVFNCRRWIIPETVYKWL